MVLNLNSDVGGIPHREANIRVDTKLALNRGNHDESKCNAPTPETVAGVELEELPNIIYQIKNFKSFVSTFTAF